MKKPLSLPKNSKAFNNNQGFTIVEALVGITVAGMVFASVAPVIMIAISTRIQTHRAEQAMQIAQGEINRIQVLMTQGVPAAEEAGKLPPPINSGVAVNQMGPPTTTVDNQSLLTASNQAFEVELDNSNTQPEFLVQIFRDQGMRFNQGRVNGQLAVFRVGVRVYSGSAKDNLTNLETTMASLNMTDNLIQHRTRPLAVLYTEISQSDVQFSLLRYREYLTPTPSPSPSP